MQKKAVLLLFSTVIFAFVKGDGGLDSLDQVRDNDERSFYKCWSGSLCRSGNYLIIKFIFCSSHFQEHQTLVSKRRQANIVFNCYSLANIVSIGMKHYPDMASIFLNNSQCEIDISQQIVSMLFNPKTINTNSKHKMFVLQATTTSMIENNVLQISLLEHHITSTIFYNAWNSQSHSDFSHCLLHSAAQL